LVAAVIGRACAPRSKRAFADWAKTTYLPDLMRFTSADLTSQHFWDQMNAVPVEKLAGIEQELVREVVRIEQLQLQALAYDTTNFYTHIASLEFCTLRHRFRPFHKGLKDFSRVCIQSGVAENPFLPSNVT
jgi:hypothetical protein